MARLTLVRNAGQLAEHKERQYSEPIPCSEGHGEATWDQNALISSCAKDDDSNPVKGAMEWRGGRKTKRQIEKGWNKEA